MLILRRFGACFARLPAYLLRWAHAEALLAIRLLTEGLPIDRWNAFLFWLLLWLDVYRLIRRDFAGIACKSKRAATGLFTT
jgi:hypothetical protein